MSPVCFSTLGCPSWPLARVIANAAAWGYDGIELRYVEGDEALHARPELTGTGLAATRRALGDAGLAVPCIASRVAFDSPDAGVRAAGADEVLRLVDAAVGLGAKGLRVFGNHIQPGATRAGTEGWIAEGLERVRDAAWPAGIEVWLESHGDFARSPHLARVLDRARGDGIGALWDAPNAFDAGERPGEGASVLGPRIRHVHVKDFTRRPGATPLPVLMGTGEFPSGEWLASRAGLAPDTWACFEWEKRWHPEIDEPEIALPHFLAWLRAH